MKKNEQEPVVVFTQSDFQTEAFKIAYELVMQSVDPKQDEKYRKLAEDALMLIVNNEKERKIRGIKKKSSRPKISDEEAYKTIEAYYQYNKNILKVSQELFISESAVRNRLKHVFGKSFREILNQMEVERALFSAKDRLFHSKVDDVSDDPL